MEKTLIVGVIVSGFILLTVPSVSAIKYHFAIDVEQVKIETRKMSTREQIVDIFLIIFAIIGGVILHRVFDIPNGGKNLRQLIAYLN
ncbi:MAG: hypothetical protein V1726_08850 [Methanobacteriota archaeon]